MYEKMLRQIRSSKQVWCKVQEKGLANWGKLQVAPCKTWKLRQTGDWQKSFADDKLGEWGTQRQVRFTVSNEYYI